MSYTDLACKNAANHLRGYLTTQHNVKLGSGRAHELVAAVLDFNSVAARKAFFREMLNPNYPDEFKWLEGNSEPVKQRLEGFIQKDPELAVLIRKSEKIAEVIAEGLKPPCDFCGKKNDSQHIEGREGGDEEIWICSSCVESPDVEDIATCPFCEPHKNIHPVDKLDDWSLCDEHTDERGVDPVD